MTVMSKGRVLRYGMKKKPKKTNRTGDDLPCIHDIETPNKTFYANMKMLSIVDGFVLFFLLFRYAVCSGLKGVVESRSFILITPERRREGEEKKGVRERKIERDTHTRK